MAGGLLNLVAVGNQNVFLTGNPKKTFFKFVYAKYTNFGLQKFRIDYEGSRTLNLKEKTHFTFKIKRHADLLMDTYLVVKLPYIWSTLYYNETVKKYIPYEFKWIENLGTQMIDEVTVKCGGETLQRFTGQYLTALVQRDFSNTKKDLYDKMTGNTKEFNDPANWGNNQFACCGENCGNGNYPNAIWSETEGGAEPSICGRNIYIPINIWFTLSSKMAFPLVALQYNELEIDISLRPVRELFTIRDVADTNGNYPQIQPNFNAEEQQLYRFLQTPPNNNILSETNEETKLIYTDKRTEWNSDIHLISTYGFLSEEERREFASKPQSYLVKQVYEYRFHNVSESAKVKLDSMGMVSSWTYFFRRSDANLRNQWSNYTNWVYNNSPGFLKYYPIISTTTPCFESEPEDCYLFNGCVTGDYNGACKKNIMLDMAILLDGKYRENVFESGIYNYIEKYTRTAGNAPDGLYCYNFCMTTNPFEFQPSGAINLSKFRNIEFEFTTIMPTRDEEAKFYQICDPETGDIVGVNKANWQIYEYAFDLFVYEERYNMVKFESGNCGLMYAR